MSVVDLQIAGGLLCLAATLLAWVVSRWRLVGDRTHFISEVLAMPWWSPGWRARGEYGSASASGLFAAGALVFCAAASLDLRGASWAVSDSWLLPTSSLVTGALLLGVVLFPLQLVPPDRKAIEEAGGVLLLHPFLAAVFYLSAGGTALALLHAGTGPIGTFLAVAHLGTSALLIITVMIVSWRTLGPAAFRPWYLPGVRILLDRRPPTDSSAEFIRQLQWPCTILIALDLGLGPAGF